MPIRKRFRLRRCIHCGEGYQPNPRAAARQKFCSDPDCQKARRRKTSKTWRRHNHFPAGEADLARVRVWREQHPGYWRKHRRRSLILELLVPLVSLKKTRFWAKLSRPKTGALRILNLFQSPGKSCVVKELFAALRIAIE